APHAEGRGSPPQDDVHGQGGAHSLNGGATATHREVECPSQRCANRRSARVGRLLIFALEPRVPECSARLSWPTGPDPRRPCTRGITTAAGRTKGCGKALRSADPATLPISPPRIERRRVIGGLISEHRRAAQRA